MNKYFVPEIEDIRVGYEAEANIKFFEDKQDNWQPFTFQGVGQEVIKYHKQGVYRVPYLTKEQIETEGWEMKEGTVVNKNGSIKMAYGFKDNFMMSVNFNKEIPFVGILFKDPSLAEPPYFDTWRMAFPCKDINTFRYICKLLGV